MSGRWYSNTRRPGAIGGASARPRPLGVNISPDMDLRVLRSGCRDSENWRHWQIACDCQCRQRGLASSFGT